MLLDKTCRVICIPFHRPSLCKKYLWDKRCRVDNRRRQLLVINTVYQVGIGFQRLNRLWSPYPPGRFVPIDRDHNARFGCFPIQSTRNWFRCRVYRHSQCHMSCYPKYNFHRCYQTHRVGLGYRDDRETRATV